MPRIPIRGAKRSLDWRIPPVLLVVLSLSSPAAVPSAEKLLPDDTLAMVAVPDCGKLMEIYQRTPQGQFWNDIATRPFRDKFMAKFRDEFVRPLERELDLRFADFTQLLQGQLTLAVTQNGWPGSEDQPLGLVLVLDTKDKSSQLKTNLAVLRQKWIQADRPLKTEKILNFDFSLLCFSTNEVPKTLRNLFPPPLEDHDIATEDLPKPAPRKSQLIFGQIDSLLIVGNSIKAVEKVAFRATGGTLPALGDLAAFDGCRQALFRDAPLYGWASVKALADLFVQKQSEKTEPEAPDPFAPINAEKLLTASGLGGLQALAFNFNNTSEGSLFQVFLSVPESSRQGVFKVLAGEPKETSPPPFVPADVIKFQRWRIDGQKAWTTVEKILSDISPQWLSAMNFLWDTATAAAKLRDPGFDLKKNLVGNLGDDLILYEKAPRGNGAVGLAQSPSLVLLGSPKPEELAVALKSLLVLSPQGGAATEREFLGRKIFSVPLPALPLMSDPPKTSGPRTLNYAASGGYVALSTDSATLEEYLRSGESQAKALRETPGLLEASQKLSAPGTSWFGYENQVEATRARFEALRKDPAAAMSASDLATLAGIVGMATAGKDISEWMDFSRLPAFEQVAKYFAFTVYGGSTTVDGLTIKWFAPTPPAINLSATAH